MPFPRTISLGESQVKINWSDGHESVFSNRSLRESCPCAMCAGEPAAIGLSEMIPLIPAAPKDVAATKYRMVGRYAVSFLWSDGHDTGIYPYDYLLRLCECQSCTAQAAERKVGQGGLIPGR